MPRDPHNWATESIDALTGNRKRAIHIKRRGGTMDMKLKNILVAQLSHQNYALYAYEDPLHGLTIELVEASEIDDFCKTHTFKEMIQGAGVPIINYP